MAEVVLQNLCKTYPDKRGAGVAVVQSINMTIRQGEFMVLVGPSGCGKSTTLRMIAGLEDISSGTVSIGGTVVNKVAPKDRDIAMVFQNYALYPHMTVFENMAFALKLRKRPKDEIETRVQEAAKMLGLTDYLERTPKALSGGQRQRVAVGRAVVRDPQVFLFDEPLSNLDAKMRVTMRAEISRLHRRLGATMIYVTHDQVEAMTMGDRICVMQGGKIMQLATPLELYHQPANLFVAGFIGTPPMNLFPGKLARGSGTVTFESEELSGAKISIPLPASWATRLGPTYSRNVALGARPETLREASPGERGVAAEVEMVEHMGADSFVHLLAGGHRFISRLSPDRRHAPGMSVTIAFDPAKIYLFDRQDGAAL